MLPPSAISSPDGSVTVFKKARGYAIGAPDEITGVGPLRSIRYTAFVVGGFGGRSLPPSSSTLPGPYVTTLPHIRVRVSAGWPIVVTPPLPRGSNRCHVWVGPPWITRPSGATAICPHHSRPVAALTGDAPFSAFC